MKYIVLLLTLFSIGCASHRVQQEDLNAWQNRDIIELEKHPYFSSLPKEERALSNGQILINYTERRLLSDRTTDCINSGTGFIEPGMGYGMGTNLCSQSTITEDNCVHQFIVEGTRIKTYRVVGDSCTTSEDKRPVSLQKK